MSTPILALTSTSIGDLNLSWSTDAHWSTGDLTVSDLLSGNLALQITSWSNTERRIFVTSVSAFLWDSFSLVVDGKAEMALADDFAMAGFLIKTLKLDSVASEVTMLSC